MSWHWFNIRSRRPLCDEDRNISTTGVGSTLKWWVLRVIPAWSVTRRLEALCLFRTASGNSVDCVAGFDASIRYLKVLTCGQVRCWHLEHSLWLLSGCVKCPHTIPRSCTWFWGSKQTCMTSLQQFSASDSVPLLPVWRHRLSGNPIPFTHLYSPFQLYALHHLSHDKSNDEAG